MLRVMDGSPSALDERERVPADDPVLSRAKDLIDDDQLIDAAELLVEALSAGDVRPELLRELAWTQRLQARYPAALTVLDAALAVDPTDLATVVDRAEVLLQLYQYPEVIAALESLPEEARAEPALRAALGTAYRELGFPALAVAAYGDPRELSWPERRAWYAA